MLQGISNTMRSLPIASIACAAAGLYIERNLCAAAIYKIGSIGAKVMASKNASAWEQTSHEYLALAKKTGIRDLTAAAGLIAIGLASGYAEEKAPQKEEPSFFQNYGLPAAVGSVLLTVGLVIGGKIGWDLKKEQVLKALNDSQFNPMSCKIIERNDNFDYFLNQIGITIRPWTI